MNYRQDTVKEILADFSARQQMRRPYELTWQLNMNFVMGNQYCQIGKADIEQQDKFYFWQQKQVFNHIAPIVETRVSRLNRVRPHAVARPFSASDSDIASAKLATKILDSAREKTNLDMLITDATMWSEVCETGLKAQIKNEKLYCAKFYMAGWSKEEAYYCINSDTFMRTELGSNYTDLTDWIDLNLS